MQLFRNILVGIDLTQYDSATHQPSAVAREVVQRALWLAERAKARLTFFTALNLTPEALPHLDEADRRNVAKTAELAAGKILGDLNHQAKAKGIESVSKLVLGSPWLEIIRQVLREQHDLLLVGTRDRKGLGRMLFGSTAVKLVRRCPCPVWVTKPDGAPHTLKILVASDLTPVAEKALCLAAHIARIAPAQIQLLHVVDFPLDRRWCTGLHDAKTEEYRRKVRDSAAKILREQIDRADAASLSPAVEIHLADDPAGLPDEGILRFIQANEIDVLVMGTIGRSGINRVMIGNTAERLLPELSCSLLAVKPAEFVCPVQL